MLRVSFNSDINNPVKTPIFPPSVILEFWRTGWFLRPVKLTQIILKMYLEPMLKVSFNSDMNNPVKTTPILQVYLWRLG